MSCAVVSKLTNCVMMRGEKRVAARLVYKALAHIQAVVGVGALKTLFEAVDNVTPYMEVRSVKVGGVSYQIPIDVAPKRRLGLAIRWIVAAARRRREAPMWAKLAGELVDSALGRSEACRKREAVRQLVDANQAFSHMGW